jgi:pyridoxal phosphate enzyme (YggS family)
MDPTGLTAVSERIAAAASKADRNDPIRLVVVVKYASDEQVDAVVAAGATHLGESRADQLAARAARHVLTWHFIGQLQSNKAKRVRASADLLHSMDRAKLVDHWTRGEARVPPVLIQVNLAGEDQKAGVQPSSARPLVDVCLQAGIEVQGLMTVPPRPEHPGDSARWFSTLRELRDDLVTDFPSVTELSMGMSDDFEVAVAEGATILRVGRAIFEPFRNEG